MEKEEKTKIYSSRDKTRKRCIQKERNRENVWKEKRGRIRKRAVAKKNEKEEAFLIEKGKQKIKKM